MKVRVRLLEAAPVSGGLMFEMVSEPKKGPPPKSVRQKLGGRARMGDKRGGLPKGVKSRMGKKRR
jgi:ribonuclease R